MSQQRLEVIDPAGAPPVWAALRNEAAAAAKRESALASLLAAVILNHKTLSSALSYQLARKLGDQELRAMSLREICEEAYESNPSLVDIAEADLKAVFERDPGLQGLCPAVPVLQGFPVAADAAGWRTGCGQRDARRSPSTCRAG